MMKRKALSRPSKDFVSDVMAATLLEKPSYDFNELFHEVHARLRARNAASSGEEMLRLRIYEKLQVLVAQGLVKKNAKIYSAVRGPLEVRIAEMAKAQAMHEQRRTAMLDRK